MIAPDSWTDRQKVEHSGRVDHGHVVLSIRPADVLLLPEKDQTKLVSLIERIGELRDGHESLPERSESDF